MLHATHQANKTDNVPVDQTGTQGLRISNTVLYAIKTSPKTNVVHTLYVLKAYVLEVRLQVRMTRSADYFSAPRCTSIARRSPRLEQRAGDDVLNAHISQPP